MYITEINIIDYIESCLIKIQEWNENNETEIARLEAREAIGVVRFAWKLDIIDDQEKEKLSDLIYITLHTL